MLEPIFDMFVQADHTLERSTSGLGVGLSLSRRLVELHGGSVTASSAGAGRGAQFVVRIPALDVERTAGARAQVEAGAAASRHRILVVDDNRDFADSLAAMLRAMGNEVRVEHDGLAARGAAEEFRPGLAFVDIGLPKMNGYDLARALRDAPGTRNAILVAVTGWGQPGDRQRAKEAGFDEHMVKPIEIDRLQEILSEA
jgi:CheY-like chemotaxis protein